MSEKKIDLRTFNFSRKKYEAEDWEQKLIEYFEFMKTQYWIKNESIKSGDLAGTTMQVETRTPLTRGNLCIYAGITKATLDNYLSNKGGYENHFAITKMALEIIDNDQIEGAMLGVYNTNLVARLQGIKEEHDHTTNGKDINQVQIFQLPDNDRD
jgi:hypothetical protein